MESTLIKHTRESDYRVAYLLETNFEQRINDVYIAKQTTRRAPYFHDMLAELIDIEATIYLEKIKHNPHESPFTDDELVMLEDMIVISQDFEAACELLLSRDPRYIQQFEYDVYQYLMDKRISFVHQDFNYRHTDIIKFENDAIVDVW